MKAPLILRRVEGHSMRPTLAPDDIVLASPLIRVRPGAVVIAQVGGREFIKRVENIEPDGIRLLGDNYYHSHDSRSFGLIGKKQVLGVALGYSRSSAGIARTLKRPA